MGLLLSLVSVFLWGILPIALIVTLQALDVFTVTWFRFLLSFGLLAFYLATRRQLPKLQKLRTMPLGLLAIAMSFLAANYVLFMQGLALTSASNAEVLIQIAPVLMGLGGLAIFQERYNLHQRVGLGVLTLGLVLFFHEQLQNLMTAQGKYLAGSGIIFLAAAAWAIYALAQKQLLQGLPSSNIMLLIYGGCAVLFSPFAAPHLILKLNHLQFGMLLFCALNTVLAYGAFAESLEHWEASRVSAVLALAPIITLIAVRAVSFLIPTLIPSENLTLLSLLGAILVVSGSVAIAMGKTR